MTTQGLNAEKSREVLQNAGLIASENAIQAELLESTLIKAGLNEEEREAILNKLGLIQGEGAEAIVQGKCTKADLEAVLAQKLKNAEDTEGIIKSLGLAKANATTTASFGLLTKGIWANIKAMAVWMVSNPIGWLMLASVAISGIIGLVDLFTTSIKEHEEKLENLKSEYSEIKSELDGLNTELKTTKDKISELERKNKLTFTESEELENLKKQNNELQRSIDLQKLKEKEALKDKNSQFINTMSADTDNIEMFTQMGQDADNITYIDRQFKILQESRVMLKQKGLSESEKDSYQSYIDDVEKYLSEKNTEFSKRAEGIDYIQNPTTEDDKKVNKWLDYINDFQDKMAIAMGGDNAKENAFNRLVDNWKFDEALNPLQKLGNEGKVTLEELKSRMSDPVFAEFVNKLADIGFIADTTDGSLRYLASAFNGVIPSAKEYIKTFDDWKLINLENEEAVKAFIETFNNEAKAIGTTTDELSKLTAEHIILNNTTLDLSAKENALKALGETSIWAKNQVSELIALMNQASGAYSVENPHDIRDGDRSGSAQLALHTLFGRWKKVDTDVDGDTTPYTSSGDKDKDKTNEALDNYLKEAENLYKIHQDEDRYINDLQWAYNNLTKNAKEQLEIEGKINEAYRDRADNIIKDLEHQIDLKKELHGEDYDTTQEWNEIQRVASDEANRYREYARKQLGYYKEGVTEQQKAEIDAWIEDTSEIQDLQKTWWDAENQKLDWRFANSKDWIDERNRLGDWGLFDDNEVEAWERVVKWLNEDYPHAVDEIKEAEENLFEARKEQFEKANDLASSYIDSQKTLLQSYYDVTNSIAEAQHEINKELETSKTMYEYLDEDTRKLLFNQEDYNVLCKELIDIQSEADRLQRQHEYDLKHSTLETIESITSNYEMQYETLMKSYEIAKADLEIAKKKQQLNNVLNERNVRMFINGQWQWVADTEQVANAKAELADAEYAKRVEEAGLTQQESINNLTKQQDELGVVIKQFENGIINLDTAVGLARQAIGEIPNAVRSIYSNLQKSSSSSSISVYGGSSSSSSGSKTVTAISASGQYIKVEKKHANGTRYTPGGTTLMGEEGFETYITSNGKLIPIGQPTIGNIPSGGIVFNTDQMKNLRTLWDMSNINLNTNKGYISRQPQQIDKRQDNRIIINGMTVDSGSSDGQALISALRRYVGNH